MITVQATDNLGAFSTIAVTIIVDNVNEAPAISGPAVTSHDEGSAADLGAYSFTDPDVATVIAWSISGDDQDLFELSNGRLSFKSPPDFENPADAGGNNVYDITVPIWCGSRRHRHGPVPLIHCLLGMATSLRWIRV